MSRERAVAHNQDHRMRDIYYLESIEQLEAIADPIRYRMYFRLAKPRTGAQLARALKISRARAHYHLNILREVGLVAFYGEGISHGITEKYYQAVAHYLDFSHLIPREDAVPNGVTMQSFKAAIAFIANMLDTSREGIARLKMHQGLGIGFHYIIDSQLTQDQFKVIHEKLTQIKDLIVEMDHRNCRSAQDLPLVDCRATLFLTPVSEKPFSSDNEDAPPESTEASTFS